MPQKICQHLNCVSFQDGPHPAGVDFWLSVVYTWRMEYCPICNGNGVPLGQLGKLFWFRCRQCGMEFSINQSIDSFNFDEDFPNEEIEETENSSGDY